MPVELPCARACRWSEVDRLFAPLQLTQIKAPSCRLLHHYFQKTGIVVL